MASLPSMVSGNSMWAGGSPGANLGFAPASIGGAYGAPRQQQPQQLQHQAMMGDMAHRPQQPFMGGMLGQAQRPYGQGLQNNYAQQQQMNMMGGWGNNQRSPMMGLFGSPMMGMGSPWGGYGGGFGGQQGQQNMMMGLFQRLLGGGGW